MATRKSPEELQELQDEVERFEKNRGPLQTNVDTIFKQIQDGELEERVLQDRAGHVVLDPHPDSGPRQAENSPDLAAGRLAEVREELGTKRGELKQAQTDVAENETAFAGATEELKNETERLRASA